MMAISMLAFPCILTPVNLNLLPNSLKAKHNVDLQQMTRLQLDTERISITPSRRAVIPTNDTVHIPLGLLLTQPLQG